MARPLVVLMARRPNPEGEGLRLSPPLLASEAAALEEAFLFDLFDRFARGRASFALGVAVDPPDARPWFAEHAPRDATLFLQRGTNPSEKQRHLFDDAFWEGWGPVATVRMNQPTLPAEHVEALVAPLLDAAGPAMTIGFDRGGGYWGLGLRAAAPALFEGESRALAIVERARAAGLRFAKAPIADTVCSLDDLAALAQTAQRPDVTPTIPRTYAALVRLGFVGRPDLP